MNHRSLDEFVHCDRFFRNTAKVALSAQVIGIQQFGDLPPSTYFACSYIASEDVSN